MCFVEVKARNLSDPLSEQPLSSAQRHRIISAARLWLQEHPDIRESSFTLVWVDQNQMRWLDNAFDG